MPYLTTGDVARRCQVSPSTVKNWIDGGELKAFKTPGGHFRIRPGALERFMATFGFPSDPDERPRLLVVDDDEDFLRFMRDALERILPAAQLEAARGGYEALLKIGSLHPHILFLDLRMPGLDGFEVCRRVKHAPETQATKIVAVTAFADESVRERALVGGADAFVTKPFTIDTLEDHIRNFLDLAAVPQILRGGDREAVAAGDRRRQSRGKRNP